MELPTEHEVACRVEDIQVPMERSTGMDAKWARNYILSRLPAPQLALLSRHLVLVNLPLQMRLLEPNRPVEHVYFPISGLISSDAVTSAGESVEVGVVGREGLTGVAGLLGHRQFLHSVRMQGPGSAFRIKTSIVRDEFLKGGVFTELIHDFLYMQMVQSTQSVLCNRLHQVEARLARWLLTSADRSETERLQLTQEILAQMLGARRSTVTVSAGVLQSKGMIDYKRGKIDIVDRPRLEASACECYRIVRSAYERMLPQQFWSGAAPCTAPQSPANVNSESMN